MILLSDPLTYGVHSSRKQGLGQLGSYSQVIKIIWQALNKLTAASFKSYIHAPKSMLQKFNSYYKLIKWGFNKGCFS